MEWNGVVKTRTFYDCTTSRLVQVRPALPLRIVPLESEPARGVVDVGEDEPRDGEEDGKDELAPQLGDRRERQEVGDDDAGYESVSCKNHTFDYY